MKKQTIMKFNVLKETQIRQQIERQQNRNYRPRIAHHQGGEIGSSASVKTQTAEIQSLGTDDFSNHNENQKPHITKIEATQLNLSPQSNRVSNPNQHNHRSFLTNPNSGRSQQNTIPPNLTSNSSSSQNSHQNCLQNIQRLQQQNKNLADGQKKIESRLDRYEQKLDETNHLMRMILQQLTANPSSSSSRRQRSQMAQRQIHQRIQSDERSQISRGNQPNSSSDRYETSQNHNNTYLMASVLTQQYQLEKQKPNYESSFNRRQNVGSNNFKSTRISSPQNRPQYIDDLRNQTSRRNYLLKGQNPIRQLTQSNQTTIQADDIFLLDDQNEEQIIPQNSMKGVSSFSHIQFLEKKQQKCKDKQKTEKAISKILNKAKKCFD